MVSIKVKRFLELVLNRDRKGVSVVRKDGKYVGSVRVDQVDRLIKGKIKGAPVRYLDRKGKWHTKGWIGRTRKDGCLSLKVNGDDVGFFNYGDFYSLIKRDVRLVVVKLKKVVRRGKR